MTSPALNEKVPKLTGCTALGTAFETGKGRPQSRPVAELLYRQACDGEAAEGCYRLGKLLRVAVDRGDWGQSAPLFVRACELGSASGCDAQAENVWPRPSRTRRPYLTYPTYPIHTYTFNPIHFYQYLPIIIT